MKIYKTTNLLTGRFYIGKDTRNKKQYLGGGMWLTRAIKKYGRRNFKKEVIENCTEDNINERERYWIKQLDAMNPSIGYNLSPGGDGNGKGFKHSEEYKERMRRHWKDYPHTAEARKKMSEASIKRVLPKGCHKGEKNTFYGKKHTEETKEKIALKKTGGHWTAAMHEKRKHYVVSEETKRKMSISLKGHNVPEHARKRMAIAKLGNTWNIGRKHSEDFKRKIKESWIKRKELKQNVTNFIYS